VSTPRRASTRDTIPDRAAYWLVVLGVYFFVGVLFFYSGKGKLFDAHWHAPAALKKQFQGTSIEKVPAVDTAWVMIGVLVLAIVAVMVLSLMRREFLPTRAKSLLTVALALALLNFACLSFGQTSTGNNEGTASLYLYFASTAIILMLVSRPARDGTLGATAASPAVANRSSAERARARTMGRDVVSAARQHTAECMPV
jgi:hypothetical protein